MSPPGRRFALAFLALLIPACAPLDPSFTRPQQRYAAALDRVTTLEDLLPFILKTSDGDFLFEPTLLRMIELSCGPKPRREVDDFLDRCEGRLKQILHEQSPRSAEKLFQALKGLDLDLDLRFKISPVAGREPGPHLENVSLLPLSRRHEGRCGSFSQFFLCLGERMGLPVSYVRMPRHAFIRLHLKNATLNFETTHPVWARDRTDDFYRDHFQGEIASGHPFFLRSLTKREAGLDAVADELCAIWLAERRYDEISRACDLLESVFGSDAALEKRFAVAYYPSVNAAGNEVLEAPPLRKAMEIAGRIRRLNPNDSEEAIFFLAVSYSLLKDPDRSREAADAILRNPRMNAEARWNALEVLKNPIFR